MINATLPLIKRGWFACIAATVITGCAGSQMPNALPGGISQNSVSADAAPDAACPVIGKTYTRGDANGKVSMTFQQAYAKAGTYEEFLRTRLVYSHWPQNRPTIYKKFVLTTCGPESGKKPIGVAREGSGETRIECVNGICTITITVDIRYTPPQTLPGRKDWKYDFIRMAPDTPKPGFEPLPVYRVVVSR